MYFSSEGVVKFVIPLVVGRPVDTQKPGWASPLFERHTMRTQHTTHQLSTFPVYCSAWISEDRLVLGGGGGASKTGVKNKLVGGNKSDALRDPCLFHHAPAWTRIVLKNP